MDEKLLSLLLGPIYAEDEMVVTVAVESLNSLGCVAATLEVDICKALTQTSNLILGQVKLADWPKRLHQILEVSVLSALGEIRHSYSQGIISVAFIHVAPTLLTDVHYKLVRIKHTLYLGFSIKKF